jgi:hypothetical protein
MDWFDVEQLTNKLARQALRHLEARATQSLVSLSPRRTAVCQLVNKIGGHAQRRINLGRRAPLPHNILYYS